MPSFLINQSNEISQETLLTAVEWLWVYAVLLVIGLALASAALIVLWKYSG